MIFPKMVDQIPKTKSKTQVLQLKAPHLCIKTLMVGLYVLALSICSVLTSTCPASVPSSAIRNSEQCTIDLHFDNLKCNFILVQPCVASQDMDLLKRLE